MTTVFSDDSLLGGPAHISAYSVREHLTRGFPADEEFYVLEGRPYSGDCALDLIYDYSCDPPREAHPFMPCWHGRQVTEREFRTMVRALHSIDGERNPSDVDFSREDGTSSAPPECGETALLSRGLKRPGR